MGSYPGRSVGSYPGRSVGSYPGRSVGSHPGRSVGSYPGRSVGSYPGRIVGSYPGRSVGILCSMNCVAIVLFVATGTPCLKVRSVRSIDRMQWLLLPKGFDNRNLRSEPHVSTKARFDMLAEAKSYQPASTTESRV